MEIPLSLSYKTANICDGILRENKENFFFLLSKKGIVRVIPLGKTVFSEVPLTYKIFVDNVSELERARMI